MVRRILKNVSSEHLGGPADILLDIKYSRASLLAEAFDVDAPVHADRGKQLRVLLDIGGELAVERLLAVNLILVVDLEKLAALDSLNNSAEWLEMAHALEVVKSLEREGLVLWATSLLKQELVNRKVGLGEVELNLATNLGLITALLLASKISAHAILLVVVTTRSSTSTAKSASPTATVTAATTSATPTIATTPAISTPLSLVTAIIALWVVLIVHLLRITTASTYFLISAIALLCAAIGLRLAVSDRSGVRLSGSFGHCVC